MNNIFCAVLAVCCMWQSSLGATITPVSHEAEFDFLVFAQFWPPSSCIYFQEKGQACDLPSYINGWTIHGLWPSNPTMDSPEFCNTSMTFDYSQIKDLKTQLDSDWHNYDKSEDPTGLWKHEWEKHGTCAYPLPSLRGEHNYFSRTLDLHKNLTTLKALSMANVVPSESQTYTRDDIFNAIVQYNKFKPIVVCDYDKKTNKSFLDQIYLCFGKDFNPRDCLETGTSYYVNCEEKDEIYYLPIKPEMSHSHSNSLFFETENDN